ncbi:molybdopterin synthase catalytic subunit [Verrucomicrobium sp. GAS474]|uniref:molybdopterin synthase catalytic subunit n=1 Tax=Verrucomicrobium sp. GAS474 TaxID=1882831 RepID=UPI000879C400|nr:molybdenum cofactor biosynthesis protein MoaE [Verrucomicrobium sp. GAS474]SDU25684.1 molybdopterin synthase catalytic subunit [Verrucomicrobium sp. GAS474]
MQVSIAFTDRPITVAPPAFPLAQDSEVGAIVDFYGVVRSLENGEPIPGLDYEAYLPMAEKELRRICAELEKDHPCRSVSFLHRLGHVTTREASLHVRVAAKHRAEAFAFAKLLIDRMKEDVPIWKI